MTFYFHPLFTTPLVLVFLWSRWPLATRPPRHKVFGSGLSSSHPLLAVRACSSSALLSQLRSGSTRREIHRAARRAMGDFWDCEEWSWTKIAILAAILLVAGGVLTVLILAFAVVKPPTALAEDAVLTRFELSPSPNNSSNSTAAKSPLQLLSYNATATLTVRNPNLYRGISYGLLAAVFSFNGTRFDESGTVAAFDLAALKETTVRLKVGDVDRALPKLPPGGAAEFARQKEAGRFEVEVRLDTVMQYKGRKTKCPLGIICPLRLQLVDPDVAATSFQKTKCTILRAKISGC